MTHNRSCASGAWREVIESLHVKTTSGAENAVERATSVEIQSARLFLCRGRDGQQGDTGVSIAREPLTQHELSDSEAASDDEDHWEDLQPAIDDTQSEQPSQRVTVRQRSVTRKTKVSGKKQALDSKKKTELVHRGRQLARVHAKQTKLDFEQRTRDATPKQTRSDTGDSPGSTNLTGKRARLTDTKEAGDTTQSSTSQPT